MRLFYAVGIPEDIRSKLLHEIEVLEDYPLKFAKTHQYHVTLLFIGDVEPRNVEFLQGALEKYTFEKFRLSLEGMRVFYDKRGAVKVIYKGVRKGREELKKIHNYLAARCGENLGNKNKRPYEPHVTLARGMVRGKGVNRSIEEEVKEIDMRGEVYEFTVREILLVNSILTPKGSEYRILSKLLLSQ